MLLASGRSGGNRGCGARAAVRCGCPAPRPLLLARPRLHTGQSVSQPRSESRGTRRFHPSSTEKESMMYLGVDGGGTKTALCFVDEGGHVAAQTQAPSCYYFAEGIDLVGRVLQEGIDDVCEQASVTPADIRHAFFGLPTYGEVSGDVPILDAIPGEVLGHDRYACDNDTVCGWAGSLGGVDGINVVSGAGSITYGERDGRGVRVGGWGDLFGDEGSAYWISIKGLNAFTRMSDGRLPVGPLHEALRTHLELAADLDLVDVVLNRWQGERSKIAALSRIVANAAEAGDECAAQILSEAVDELVNLVDTTRRLLDFDLKEKVPV